MGEGTGGEHIGWRNYKQWQVKCKSADIPDAPETSFRRWKNKEIAAFDCEPTKDTPESAPIRHRDQVLGLLDQVIRDRAFRANNFGSGGASLAEQTQKCWTSFPYPSGVVSGIKGQMP